MLGLFSASHLPYTLDQRNSDTDRTLVPTLAEMAEVALKALSSGPNGFLLQIEGGRVDHAAHANDAASMLWDQLAFDEAIEVALRYAEHRPETLIVITSDHGNANPGLNGMGTEYRDSTKCFERLAEVKSSFYAISPRLGGVAEYTMKADTAVAATPKLAAESVRELARTHFGFDFTIDEVEILRNAVSGQKRLSANKQLDSLVGLMGQVVGNHVGVGWTGTSHTSDYTLVTALGPGAERFAGLIRNTQVFPALMELMDMKFQNPSMEPAQAKQYRAAAAQQHRERPDWA
jgi:alkaline phosphatase